MHGHEEWLRIAKEDLLAAKALVKVELFSAVVYHCKQSSEKLLKAYLVFKKQPVIKTHDLIKLLELCMTLDRNFKEKFDAANYINPFSSKFRYPSEFEVPDLEEAQLTIKHTESMMRFVLKKIAEPETGQKSILD